MGFGGQGIILAGVILGEAATRAGHRAVQTQSYGPESRGGAARSEVVISSEEIDYPRVSYADVVVALSQEGYEKFGTEVGDGGIVVVDSDLVKADTARTVPFTSGKISSRGTMGMPDKTLTGMDCRPVGPMTVTSSAIGCPTAQPATSSSTTKIRTSRCAGEGLSSRSDFIV